VGDAAGGGKWKVGKDQGCGRSQGGSGSTFIIVKGKTKFWGTLHGGQVKVKKTVWTGVGEKCKRNIR